jgi:hypothetical protein
MGKSRHTPVSREEVARAIAFFERSEELSLLLDILNQVRPRAASAVGNLQRRGQPIPTPLEIEAAAEPATREEAIHIVRAVRDFGELQALTRAIGRRVEELRAGGHIE